MKIILNRLKMLVNALPFVIGFITFLVVVGPRVLNPSNIAWLGNGHADLAVNYLGWDFFRHTDWLFPLGLNPRYGIELGNAIIFSDSNPLFALLFKPFSFVLPGVFQYFGIWLLFCFLLQAWFGWKLCELISESLLIRGIGATIFVFSPPMLWRLGYHLSLSGHFLILAALWLVFNTRLGKRKLAWGLLLVVTAMVHAYLLAMVAGLWLADLLGRKWKAELLWRQTVIELFILIFIVGIVCWQVGYFAVGEGVVTEGYGFYRMTLSSLFDSSGWSYILKDIPEAGGDYEGFNYLGSGVIFLLILSVGGVFMRNSDLTHYPRRFPFLVVLLIVLSLFAISNQVGGFGFWGFRYPLPESILRLANIFRSSGRMFWPVFYVIVFATIFFLVRNYPKRAGIWLLLIALAIQIADTHAGWGGVRNKMMTEAKLAWTTPLVSPFWHEAASRYQKVRWVLPANISPHWQLLAAYASIHGMATDAVYLSRVGKIALENARDKAVTAMRTGDYEQDTLYVLDENVLLQVTPNVKESDLLVRIDGFNVLAPQWKHCVTCWQPAK